MQQKQDKNAQEIAQKLGKLLGDLEKHDKQPQNLGLLVQQCQEYQKQLEDIFLGKQKRYKLATQNNIRMLKQFQERINKQEQILIDKGQDIVGQMLINKLQQNCSVLENEQYSSENEKKELEKKCEQHCKQLQHLLKFIKNKDLENQIQNNLENYQKKKNLKGIIQNGNNLSENDLKAQFSVLDGISQINDVENMDYNQQQQQLQFNQQNNSTVQIISDGNFDFIKLKTLLDEDIEEEKQQDFDRLQQEAIQINQLQQEILQLTNDNGQKIEIISDQQESVLENVQQANEQMKEAYIDSQKIRRNKIKAFFVGIGIFIGYKTFGEFGAAVGVDIGLKIGRGIGKLVTGQDSQCEVKKIKKKQKKAKK